MKYCPITYNLIADNELYSAQGLRLLSPQLKSLETLNYSAAEQRAEAIARVGKMSIQGVQDKLSAQLKVTEGYFEIVDSQGHYILKPQSQFYPELPQNEALTMSLAALLAFDVPVHGLLYSKDGSFTYFIKRFDRYGHNKKLAVEDFAQLSQRTRDTKYDSSMERIVKVIAEFCSFPKIEFVKLFRLTLFNFLVGNEDMHLKNFSLITHDKKIILAPAYDWLNTTIAQRNSKEELALSLNGKKNNLTYNDFIKYFGAKLLGLNDKIILEVLNNFQQALPAWDDLIGKSFLSEDMKSKYRMIIRERSQRLLNCNC